MKNILTGLLGLAALAIAFLPTSAFALNSTVSHPFGLGLIVGEPTALTGKYWLNSTAAIDGGIGVSFDNSTLIYGDYLLHFPGTFGRATEFATQVTPYVGIGGIIAFNHGANADDHHFFGRSNDSLGIGFRIPLGAEWRPSQVPLGAFVELVPGLALLPNTSGILEVGVGIRYYF